MKRKENYLKMPFAITSNKYRARKTRFETKEEGRKKKKIRKELNLRKKLLKMNRARRYWARY